MDADNPIDLASKALEIAFDVRDRVDKLPDDAVDDETRQLAEDTYATIHRLYVKLYQQSMRATQTKSD